MDYKAHIREAEGQNRYDFTLLFADAAIFKQVSKALAAPFQNSRVEKVAALDALGFALGGSVASSLGAGLVLVRKQDKTPWNVITTDFIDYSGIEKRFELSTDAISPDERVLIVDDWSETGTQLRAALELIERLKGQVVGMALLGCDEAVAEDMKLKGYSLHRLVKGD